jgi:hypothetical protein
METTRVQQVHRKANPNSAQGRLTEEEFLSRCELIASKTTKRGTTYLFKSLDAPVWKLTARSNCSQKHRKDLGKKKDVINLIKESKRFERIDWNTATIKDVKITNRAWYYTGSNWLMETKQMRFIGVEVMFKNTTTEFITKKFIVKEQIALKYWESFLATALKNWDLAHDRKANRKSTPENREGTPENREGTPTTRNQQPLLTPGRETRIARQQSGTSNPEPSKQAKTKRKIKTPATITPALPKDTGRPPRQPSHDSNLEPATWSQQALPRPKNLKGTPITPASPRPRRLRKLAS